MLLDDGGDLTAIMHNEYKDLLKDVRCFGGNNYWN